ncbi:hypothetical protein NQ317_001776, partial [Molorchus minor]
MDIERNTPLHVIVKYHKALSDFMTLNLIIVVNLMNHGAHMIIGETPLEAAATAVAEIVLKSEMKLSLKSLAANAVKQHKVKLPRTSASGFGVLYRTSRAWYKEKSSQCS